MPQVNFSPLNPFAMRPVVSTRPTKYHRGHLDSEWQKDLILSPQYEAEYLQKVERADRFRFSFDATDNAAQSLKLIDCTGLTVVTLTLSADEDIPGNVTANSAQYHTYLYKAADLTAVTDDGVYYLLLDVDGDKYISHPILIKDTHDDTMLIEYWHSENSQGMYFEQLPQHHNIRVEAYIDKMEAVSSDTVYEDQSYNLEQLDANPYRVWKLFAGYTGEGLPDWMIDKLNRIFACDHVYLDGKQYVKNNGAKWSNEGGGVLYASTLEIREADNNEGFSFGAQAFDLFTVPSYPFAIQSISIGKNSPSIPLPVVSVIADLTALTAWITALNTALPDYELYGTVSNDSGTIIYTNGTGEDYNTASSNIYTTKFSVTIDISAIGVSGEVAMYIAMGAPVIDWTDGTVETDDFDPTLTQTISHAFIAPASTENIDIWGPIEGFKMIDPARIDLTGDLPEGLKVLELTNGAMDSDTFDADLLIPCADTLTRIKVSNNGLTAIPNFNATSFPLLARWDFSGNALPQSVYNAIIYDCLYNVDAVGWNNGIQYGVLNVTGQSTNPALTALGASSMTTLQTSYFWTVIP